MSVPLATLPKIQQTSQWKCIAKDIQKVKGAATMSRWSASTSATIASQMGTMRGMQAFKP